MIRGGDWPSSVPSSATFDMRIGFFPGTDLARIRAEIEACLHKAAVPFLPHLSLSLVLPSITQL
jgi:acetylornithine deacetylase/succinyl-diaminopimelate desuccinylase-like protein